MGIERGREMSIDRETNQKKNGHRERERKRERERVLCM